MTAQLSDHLMGNSRLFCGVAAFQGDEHAAYPQEWQAKLRQQSAGNQIQSSIGSISENSFHQAVAIPSHPGHSGVSRSCLYGIQDFSSEKPPVFSGWIKTAKPSGTAGTAGCPASNAVPFRAVPEPR